MAQIVKRFSNVRFKRNPKFKYKSNYNRFQKGGSSSSNTSSGGYKTGMVDWSTIRCFNRNELGHFATECRKPRQVRKNSYDSNQKSNSERACLAKGRSWDDTDSEDEEVGNLALMAIDGNTSSSRKEVKFTDVKLVYHLGGSLDCARRDNELLSQQIKDLEKEVNELRLVHINQDKLKEQVSFLENRVNCYRQPETILKDKITGLETKVKAYFNSCSKAKKFYSKQAVNQTSGICFDYNAAIGELGINCPPHVCAKGHASSSTPSVSSSSVGMVSSKCVESVSKGSDLDCIIVTQEDNLVAKNDQGQEQPAKRKKPLKSEVWNHFDRIEIDTKGSSMCLQDESVLIWFSGKEEKLLKLSHVSRIISGLRTEEIRAEDRANEKVVSKPSVSKVPVKVVKATETNSDTHELDNKNAMSIMHNLPVVNPSHKHMNNRKHDRSKTTSPSKARKETFMPKAKQKFVKAVYKVKCPVIEKVENIKVKNVILPDKGQFYNGSSRHMTEDRALLSNVVEKAGPMVTFGDKSKGLTEGYGCLQADSSDEFNKDGDLRTPIAPSVTSLRMAKVIFLAGTAEFWSYERSDTLVRMSVNTSGEKSETHHDNQLNWYDNQIDILKVMLVQIDCHTESSTSYGIVLLVQEIVIPIVMLVQEIVIPIVMLVQEIVSPKVMPIHRLSCQFISVLLIKFKSQAAEDIQFTLKNKK
ncbi:hypothetical protein AgCh_001147 [Apium graveolens]